MPKTKQKKVPVAWLLFSYKGKQYSCIGYAYEDDGELITPYEWDGVRTCQHDYASVINNFYPGEPVSPEDAEKCDRDNIELLNYYILQP